MSPHGTPSRYTNDGCRCTRCRKAHTNAQRPFNSARIEALHALARRYPDEYQAQYDKALRRRGLKRQPRGRPRDPNLGCGSEAGYARHLRDGTEPCARCRKARSARVQERRLAKQKVAA